VIFRVVKRAGTVAVYFSHEAVACRIVLRPKVSVEAVKTLRGASDNARCFGGSTLVSRYEAAYEVRSTDGLGDPCWVPMKNPPGDMLAAALYELGQAYGAVIE